MDYSDETHTNRPLHGRDFLTLHDFTKEEIHYLLDFSAQLKHKKQQGIIGDALLQKNIVLLFEKTSTRTRCAFETAVYDEGGHITFLGKHDSQIGKKESLEDSAKVLSQFYDGIEFRGFEHTSIIKLAEHASVPVWNGLTDTYHPTQVLADYLTMIEHIKKPYNEITFVFIGDINNNMGNSLMVIAAKLGVNYVGIAPTSMHPNPSSIVALQDMAKAEGGSIHITEDIDEGVKNADVIYGDTWVSMGDENIAKEKITLLSPYKITGDIFHKTHNPHTIFLHCLPSFHNFETDFAKEMQKQGLDVREVEHEVFSASYSKVFEQAGNRLHTIKAIILATIGRE